MCTDLNGLAYATVANLKPGDIVTCDIDFGCFVPGQRKRIMKSKAQEDANWPLYIRCKHGKHFIEPQIDESRTFYIGIYPT